MTRGSPNAPMSQNGRLSAHFCLIRVKRPIDRFMALISHCSQQSSPTTKEQKRQSLAVAKKIICENRKEAAEYFADSVTTATGVEFGGCIIEKNRKHIWFGYAN